MCPFFRGHTINDVNDFLTDNNAAITIEEKDLSKDRLKEEILTLIKDTHRLQEISNNSKHLGNPDAGRLLADEVLGVSNVKE